MHLIQRPRYQRGLCKIQHASGPHEDLLTIVKRHQLKWYGYVSPSSGLPKTSCKAQSKRGRRQGKLKKRWVDINREWTCLELVKSQRAVENREIWRKQVVKSSVVPMQPLRWRDRWRWRRALTYLVQLMQQQVRFMILCLTGWVAFLSPDGAGRRPFLFSDNDLTHCVISLHFLLKLGTRQCSCSPRQFLFLSQKRGIRSEDLAGSLLS